MGLAIQLIGTVFVILGCTILVIAVFVGKILLEEWY